MKRRFKQVDVFSSGPFNGNPVAVVLDGEGLSTEEMLRFTRWTNLSEATFVLPPTSAEADYRVRIFTPATELPFAGHPTIGTCQAWIEAGGTPREAGRVVQECGVGLVSLRPIEAGFAFVSPPLVRSGAASAEEARRVAAVLGVPVGEIEAVEWVDNGPGWIAAVLRDPEAVLAVQADLSRASGPSGGFFGVGVVAAYPPGSECQFEVRAFFRTPQGTGEDPVTGSLNASLARWMLGSGRARSPYVASQGTALGRAGRVYVEESEGEIWVGGRATTFIDGEVEI